jgi:hypothetical protein
MKAKVKYSIATMEEVIDLVAYGYEDDVSWSDLEVDEQNEIRDNLSEVNLVYCNVEALEE